LGGTVNLFHGGLYKKLATTSTGIDVTGSVTCDTLIIDNANATNEITFSGSEFTNIFSSSTSGFQLGTTSAGYLSLLTNNAERMRIDGTGIDVTGNVTATAFYGDGSNLAGVSSNTTPQGMYEHSASINSNYTIGVGNNAMSAGPITIATGVTVTVPGTSNWVIV